jgi:hypothetical protein
MPHYVKKLWEKFLLPCTIYLSERQTSGIQKLLERWEEVAIVKYYSFFIFISHMIAFFFYVFG